MKRCSYVLPGISVLSEFSAETRHCVEAEGHLGAHMFDLPRIVGKTEVRASDTYFAYVKHGRQKPPDCI